MESRNGLRKGGRNSGAGVSDGSNGVSFTLIESLLESRIDQAVAITTPADQERIDVLMAIRNIPGMAMRLASFCDYMIDYASSLSLELNRARLRPAGDAERTDRRIQRIAARLGCSSASIESAIEDVISGPNHQADYERARALLDVPNGCVGEAVADALQENLKLQRLHNQDRALLIKQNEMIMSLKRNGEDEGDESDDDVDDADIGGLRQEFRDIANELGRLDRDMKNRLSSFKVLKRR